MRLGEHRCSLLNAQWWWFNALLSGALNLNDIDNNNFEWEIEMLYSIKAVIWPNEWKLCSVRICYVTNSKSTLYRKSRNMKPKLYILDQYHRFFLIQFVLYMHKRNYHIICKVIITALHPTYENSICVWCIAYKDENLIHKAVLPNGIQLESTFRNHTIQY